MGKSPKSEMESLRQRIALLEDENYLLKGGKMGVASADEPSNSELFRLTFDNVSDGICIVRITDKLEPRVIAANRVALTNHGYTLQEFKEISIYDLVSDEQKKQIRERIEKLLSGDDVTFESQFFKKDGTEIFLKVSSKLVRFRGVPYIYSLERDITDYVRVMEQNKRTVEALQHSEENYRLLFYDSPLAIYIADPQGNVLDANNTLLNLLGSPSLEATKQINILKYKPLIENGYAEKFMEAMSTGKTIKFDVLYKSKWGKLAHLASTIYPLPNAQGECNRVYTVMEDVSQQKKAEAALIKSRDELKKLNENLKDLIDKEVKKNREKDKMMIIQSKQAAMGEMIENIAHQWRQPLNDIGLSIQDLQDSFEFNEFTEEALNTTVKQVMDRLNYMSRTIDDFRNFFRSDKEKVLFSLSHAIQNSFSLVRASYKNNFIETVFSIDEDVFFKGYPNEFSQAVLNILNNARDVLVQRKTKKPVVKISLESKGDNIFITIANNGGQISQDIIDRVFEPYFTTKEKLSGIGLGLYISKTIIERNMFGKLSVHNIAGGVEFVITFSKSWNNSD